MKFSFFSLGLPAIRHMTSGGVTRGVGNRDQRMPNARAFQPAAA